MAHHFGKTWNKDDGLIGVCLLWMFFHVLSCAVLIWMVGLYIIIVVQSYLLPVIPSTVVLTLFIYKCVVIYNNYE